MTQQPTVCVRVWGGLGNQMFCAAAGMALAHRLNASLELDLQHYDSPGPHSYHLGIFGLPAKVRPKASPNAKPLRFQLNRKRLARWGVPSDWTGSVWREPGFHYDSAFERLAGSVYLLGYFQSPKYFEDVATDVRAAFDLRAHLSPIGATLAHSAQENDTIAVHVRRGDYVSNPNATAYHGIMAGDYYRRALDLIARHMDRPRLFVMSDDEASARDLLAADWPDAQFISGTTLFDDMHIISSCRHRILANSSFSWWGAWLDPRSDGLTIAPRAWFARETMLHTHVGDLFPAQWFLT